MSLINEALKRTRDASTRTSQTRMTVDTYRMSNREESSAIGSRSGVWVSLLVLVMAAAAVLVFALRVVKPGENVRQALINAEEAPPLPPPVVTKVEPVVVPATTVKHEEPPAPVVVVAVPAAPAPAPVIPVAPPPAPEPPTKFVLQGIISSATGREATINNFAVRVGDEVDGAKVVAIESRRVKLQQGDHEILLRMP